MEERIVMELLGAEGRLEKCQLYNWHFRLRDSLLAAYRETVGHPEPGWIYMHWDFEEPILMN
eukprot:1375912-Lingulodinium_polyedra.AAC.1